jgi:hypothetical protein
MATSVRCCMERVTFRLQEFIYYFHRVRANMLALQD